MNLPSYSDFKKEIAHLRRSELAVMLLITDTIENKAELDFTTENISLLKQSCEALLYVLHRFENHGSGFSVYLIDGYREHEGHIYIYPNMDLHVLWVKFLKEKQAEAQKLKELEEEERLELSKGIADE